MINGFNIIATIGGGAPLGMTGTAAVWLAVAVAALVAHGGVMVAGYNRVNALPWPRWVIKAVTKWMLAFTAAVPLAATIDGSDGWAGYFHGRWGQLPMWIVGYGITVLPLGIVLGARWLTTRPSTERTNLRLHREVEIVDVADETGVDLCRTTHARRRSRLPMNCHLQLSIETFDLPVPGWPAEWDGYKIAHLSDIHFTGEIDPAFASHAVDRARAWQPDAIVLTGDLLDADECVDWIGPAFGRAIAGESGRGRPIPDGCRFVLGNHDLRVTDPRATRLAMETAGWIDVGGRVQVSEIRGQPVRWIGNEAPWFPPPADSEVTSSGGAPAILLSHSPDQIDWARRHDVRLMLAGHTHGGQGRLPIAGPILSPSRHGSRFASGDFYLPPTTMHVSRGLAGVHTVRFRCRPELSRLRIRSTGTQSAADGSGSV